MFELFCLFLLYFTPPLNPLPLGGDLVAKSSILLLSGRKLTFDSQTLIRIKYFKFNKIALQR